MLNDKKDRITHFLKANQISFNICYLKNVVKCKVAILILSILVSK